MIRCTQNARKVALALFTAVAGGTAIAGVTAAAGARAATAEPPRQELERVAAWPEPGKGQKESIELDLERLRKARNPELAELGRSGLGAAGAASATFCLRALGKEQDEAARARLAAVLDEITGAAHTRCLAPEFASKAPHVRLDSLRRASAFPDAGTREAAEAALARARAAKPSETRADELCAAALAVSASGSLAGFDVVLEEARTRWPQQAAAMRLALAGVRGAEATEAVSKAMAGADRTHLVAALNVLSACGERGTAPALARPHLDSEDNSVLVAAINALRAIVDGAPPLENLSAFETIGEAKKWKARL